MCGRGTWWGRLGSSFMWTTTKQSKKCNFKLDSASCVLFQAFQSHRAMGWERLASEVWQSRFKVIFWWLNKIWVHFNNLTRNKLSVAWLITKIRLIADLNNLLLILWVRSTSVCSIFFLPCNSGLPPFYLVRAVQSVRRHSTSETPSMGIITLVELLSVNSCLLKTGDCPNG